LYQKKVTATLAGNSHLIKEKDCFGRRNIRPKAMVYIMPKENLITYLQSRRYRKQAGKMGEAATIALTTDQ
jgi:hypothetical protein